MRKLLLSLSFLTFVTFSFAQEAKKDDWIRVQSDDGEFSIEVPASYGYFFDKEGIIAFNGSFYYQTSEMSIFNSYTEHTLINFESFKGHISPKNIKTFISSDPDFLESHKHKRVLSEIDKNGLKIARAEYKNDNQYSIKQYLFSEDYIYILTASSRLGKTAAMMRFLDSLIFSPKTGNSKSTNETRFPSLKITPIVFEEILGKQKTNQPAVGFQEIIKPLFILAQPKVFTLNSPAGGTVRLNLVLSETGQITKISVLEKLTPKFRSEVLLTVLRMQFLPYEKDDIPVSITKTLDYDFDSYQAIRVKEAFQKRGLN